MIVGAIVPAHQFENAVESMLAQVDPHYSHPALCPEALQAAGYCLDCLEQGRMMQDDDCLCS